MNFLLISQGFPPPVENGMVRYISNLAYGLHEAGHSVCIMSRYSEESSPNPFKTSQEKDFYIYRYVSVGKLKKRPESWIRLARLLDSKIQKHNIDLIIVQHPYHAPAALYISRKRHIPLIYIAHTSAAHDRSIRNGDKDYSHDVENEEREKMAIQNADAVVCVSESLRQLILKSYGKNLDNLHVIPTGIMPPKPIPSIITKKIKKNITSGNKKIVLFVGRESWEKGTDFLPDIIGRTEKKSKSVLFVLAGLDRQYWARFMLFPSVIPIPWLSSAELAEIYKMSDILLVPSRRDAMPFVLLEAMFFNTVPVVSDIDGPGELIQHGINGMKFPVKRENGRVVIDIEIPSDHIITLLKNEELCHRLKSNAKSSVEKKHTIQNQVRKFMQIVEKITGSS